MNYVSVLSPSRAEVVKNIEAALLDGDTFRKVETSDPDPSSEDIERVIVPFDNLRRSPIAKLKAFIARLIGEKFTKAVNGNTEIVGLENVLGIEGGALITANHYNPTDSTPPRLLAIASGRRKKLHIIVQEKNIFMTGLFGFLMKNCNTHPVTRNPRYMAKNLRPALKKIIDRGSFVLIYPEQEMWWNYKKPRPLRDGAYHYAAEFGVPIIPTFTEMITLPGERDGDGALPVKHVLHVLPPIYPDPKKSIRENREIMLAKDLDLKREAYRACYGEYPSDSFIPERDIAGIAASTEK